MLGISFLSFLFLELAPGEYFDEMRLNPQISSETLAALRSRYGLDRTMLARYLDWFISVGRGDWGFSFAYNTPVSLLLWSRAFNTLLLTGSATVIAWLLAVPAGVWWAMKGDGWWNRLWGAGTATLLSVPEVLLALLFLLIAVKTRAFPAGGMSSVGEEGLAGWGKIKDLAWHLVLPVLVLVLSGLGILVRQVRASVAETLKAPFVRAVLACGIGKRRMILHHVLRPAANPLITLFGFSIASLLSGSLLVEVVMGWPGLGPLLLEAILARDLYVVMAAVVCSALFLVAGNVVADLLLYLSDPRIAMR